MENWITIATPGYLGAERDVRYKEWDEIYGEGNWRLVWVVNKTLVDFLGACALYEDAYYHFLKKNSAIVKKLVYDARDIYDDAPSNVESRFDYNHQETGRTHIQDIAIRRCMVRMGLWFMGNDLIQIRSSGKDEQVLGNILSPGNVPFHMPYLISEFELSGWWKPKSVESFYQSNRLFQIR
ncbi:MAG TPA: hypothetical protein P5080_01355 [Candidatus Paceibacterota bacterium]|nr:hypothetical protein [Candidatus Pacearchaeota archaeon]HRZ50763.1 hypothetical protein [Candidatus Paceibacterota bacterium]HSA36340.1 hypothetical protein [Candidatus Paceibacterota bacterium]